MSENNDNKIVRVSTCKICKGFVTAIALEKVDSKSLGRFEREVKKYDLEVADYKLKDWREVEIDFCSCDEN
jgi:hypothetical protein